MSFVSSPDLVKIFFYFCILLLLLLVIKMVTIEVLVPFFFVRNLGVF